MGVLESRVLDFETVIITSVNEENFRQERSMNSFIPYDDVKRELGLPTYKEKMLFIRITFIIYYKEPKCFPNIIPKVKELMEKKSRFITQLEVEITKSRLRIEF
jgi:hypothetical protein